MQYDVTSNVEIKPLNSLAMCLTRFGTGSLVKGQR